MQRAFACDGLVCSKCGGAMRLVAVVQAPAVVEKILRHLRLWQRGPPWARRVVLEPATRAWPRAASSLLGQCGESSTQTPPEGAPPHRRS
jgi:hypothetical protein